MNDIQLYSKLIDLPEHLKQQVLEFIESIKLKEKNEKPINDRKAGLAKGLIKMTDDFDDPIEGF